MVLDHFGVSCQDVNGMCVGLDEPISGSSWQYMEFIGVFSALILKMVMVLSKFALRPSRQPSVTQTTTTSSSSICGAVCPRQSSS
jgi:hypothetical protein